MSAIQTPGSAPGTRYRNLEAECELPPALVDIGRLLDSVESQTERLP